jgi:hypothetical protein
VATPAAVTRNFAAQNRALTLGTFTAAGWGKKLRLVMTG